jgi:hypothetical protein
MFMLPLIEDPGFVCHVRAINARHLSSQAGGTAVGNLWVRGGWVETNDYAQQEKDQESFSHPETSKIRGCVTNLFCRGCHGFYSNFQPKSERND